MVWFRRALEPFSAIRAFLGLSWNLGAIWGDRGAILVYSGGALGSLGARVVFIFINGTWLPGANWLIRLWISVWFAFGGSSGPLRQSWGHLGVIFGHLEDWKLP